MSTDLPLLSIAIATYNHKSFLASAIESALVITYPNTEIIISDDASTDDTLKIAKTYAAKYPDKIRVLETQQNMGAVGNWFKCISNAKGKYVTGLAGDDELYPDGVSKQIAIMEQDPDITICYADAVVFSTAAQKELYRLSDKTAPQSGDIKTALRDAIYYSPTMMFRRKFMPKENIFAHLRSGADLAFYKEIMILSGPKGRIYYLPEVVYKYQKHDTNITVTQTEYRKEHIEAIQILQRKYPEYNKDLAPSIYDFCCVAFFKSLAKARFMDALFFSRNGFEAANYNPIKFFRALWWGVGFWAKKLLRDT